MDVKNGEVSDPAMAVPAFLALSSLGGRRVVDDVLHSICCFGPSLASGG